MTAFGTVGAVIAAVSIALWTEWRSGKRLKAEQEHSDKMLAEERQRSSAALEDERAYGRAQLEEEPRLAVEREQFAEAYAVQVAFGERDPGQGKPDVQGRRTPSEVRELAVVVVNRGPSAITRIEARFCLGNSMVDPRRGVRLSGSQTLDPLLLPSFEVSAERSLRGLLTPWDMGMRFESDGIHERELAGWYPLVRWTDRWGTRWEHKRGVVRTVREDEPWEP
jgi:hypothetical protein